MLVNIASSSLRFSAKLTICPFIGKPDMETYLHRIGRTGRFGRKGMAINMVEPKHMSHIEAIANHFGKPIKRLCEEDIEALN